MIAEFSIVPIGAGESLSAYVAESVKIVRRSGLKHQLTPMGTVVEGDLDEVINVILECHRKVRSMSDRVLTQISIDDRKGSPSMDSKVRSVATKLD